jgi:hypothetical protein
MTKVVAISISETGSIVLSDEDLSFVEAHADLVSAGGASSNAECRNHANCGNSNNAGCVNGACPGSTNRGCQGDTGIVVED